MISFLDGVFAKSWSFLYNFRTSDFICSNKGECLRLSFGPFVAGSQRSKTCSSYSADDTCMVPSSLFLFSFFRSRSFLHIAYLLSAQVAPNLDRIFAGIENQTLNFMGICP